jgi:signal transduction histidine kinase
LRIGADDFLTKPIDVVEMTLRVKHLLQLRALHKELSYARQSLATEVEARTSDLEAAMERLESLVKAKDVFVAGVSHELRIPLTAVLGYAAEMAAEPERMSREEVLGAERLIFEQASDGHRLSS